MYAKKSLGQHFLKSERALAAIIEAGKLSSDDTVLEIGPGTGNLTRKILGAGVKIIAMEKDDNLYEFLQREFEKEIKSGQLKLLHEDILDFDSQSIKIGYKIIANIPYNITGAILEKFLSAAHQPELMVLLVQKEVAERIVARDEKESILSISVKAYGVPRYIETVKAGSFAPAPKVDSAIIAIENIHKNFFEGFSEDQFFKLLKTGFQSKRKKLSSNLSNMISKEKVLEAFKKLGLNENLRAENVSIDLWKELSASLLS